MGGFRREVAGRSIGPIGRVIGKGRLRVWCWEVGYGQCGFLDGLAVAGEVCSIAIFASLMRLFISISGFCSRYVLLSTISETHSQCFPQYSFAILRY